VALAVNTGEAATPLSSVIAVFTPPANLPLAPDGGAVNVTTTPLIGERPAVTVANSRAENAAPTNALCPDPLSAAIEAAGDAGVLLLIPLHATSVAIMASVVSNKINWRVFIAALHPRGPGSLRCFPRRH
jgi:hypothetical protein